MNKRPMALIILSTYNGERFLKALLDSLLKQDYTNFNVLIRDDGSHDGTLDILQEYEILPNIKVIYEKNIGAKESFFKLLGKASSYDAQYIAFCDQDDVWMQGKLSKAISCLEQEVPRDVPGMYFSRYKIVDENLNIKGYSQIPKRGPSFANSLVQNIVTGCTMVINRQAMLTVLKEIPRKVRMHDWWIYQVVSAFGVVIYDSIPAIMYRQHSTNVVGDRVNILSKWVHRLKRFLKQGHLPLIAEQAREFYRIFYEDLPVERKQILYSFIFGRDYFFARVKYALHCPVYRQTVAENLIFRILIVLNRI